MFEWIGKKVLIVDVLYIFILTKPQGECIISDDEDIIVI